MTDLRFLWLGAGKTTANIDGGVQTGDIIFLSDKQQIIVNGTTFGVTDAQAQAIKDATTGISDLNTRVEMTTQLSVTILDILRDTRTKLDGGNLGQQGWQGVQSIDNIGGQEYTNVVAAINALNALIGNIDTTITGVQGRIGAEENARATAIQGVQNQITGVQNKIGDIGDATVKSYVDDSIAGVQSRIGTEENARATAIEGVQGQIAGVQSGVQSKIGDLGNQSVKEYIESAAAGAQSAAINAANAAVNALAGEDWTNNAKTVKAIIDELSDEGNADFTSVVDKVRGDYSIEGVTGPQNIKNYIDAKVGAVNTAGSQGVEEAKAYTNTQISGVQGQIANLDAQETGTTNFVGVQVTQTDGKITGVQVTTSGIASTDALSNVETLANNGYQGAQSALQKLQWVVV